MYELLVLSLLMHWPLHAYKIARMANNIIGPEEQMSRGTLPSLLAISLSRRMIAICFQRLLQMLGRSRAPGGRLSPS